MAKAQTAQTGKAAEAQKDEDKEYSFRELERAYKKNGKAIEALKGLPQDADIKTSITKLLRNNELIKKRAYKIVDEKFGTENGTE